MFGVLLSNELSKFALENPKQITPPGGYKPKPITPGLSPAPAPVTPSDPYAPIPKQVHRNFNPGYNKMASQESTMNMFGVLVNMELQKLASGEENGLPMPDFATKYKKKGPDLATDVNEALDKARKAKKKPQ